MERKISRPGGCRGLIPPATRSPVVALPERRWTRVLGSEQPSVAPSTRDDGPLAGRLDMERGLHRRGSSAPTLITPRSAPRENRPAVARCAAGRKPKAPATRYAMIRQMNGRARIPAFAHRRAEAARGTAEPRAAERSDTTIVLTDGTTFTVIFDADGEPNNVVLTMPPFQTG